ncbi:MAG TPA: class I SAM-dependent methyltransferase [Gemmatimonadales bacterium]|nr:class I SAM-dependent methyltransferase [Gemmatimonadales bacterium]
MAPAPRMYHDLARWWPLLSPPSEYLEEAADLLSRLPRGSGSRRTLLELGAGGGSLAAHLKHHYEMTLTDRSAEMLAVSRTANPECEHIQGDMRTLRLHRRFDVVLVHDAIMYAVEPDDVRATLSTAALHCRGGGTVAVLPDYVRETFAAGTDCDGRDAADGRGLRYLEWRWDPDPTDNTYLVDYAFLLRESDGTILVEHDRHTEGLFPRADWLVWFEEAGFITQTALDSSGREIFLGTPRDTVVKP